MGKGLYARLYCNASLLRMLYLSHLIVAASVLALFHLERHGSRLVYLCVVLVRPVWFLGCRWLSLLSRSDLFRDFPIRLDCLAVIVRRPVSDVSQVAGWNGVLARSSAAQGRRVMVIARRIRGAVDGRTRSRGWMGRPGNNRRPGQEVAGATRIT